MYGWPRMILLASLVLLPQCTGAPTKTDWTTYADSLRAFSVAVPAAWHKIPADYNFARYLWVFLSINNQAPGFHLADESTRIQRYGSFLNMVATQLKPGMVYVDFAHGEGPASVPHYGAGREHSFETALAKLVERSKPASGTEDIDFDQLDFVKWGTGWHIYLYCRKPYASRDRDLAIEMIKSLRFSETPIVNDAQAVGVAVRHLPPNAEPTGEWPAINARDGRYSTTIEHVGNAFSVTFVLYATGVSDEVSWRWTYLVNRDGSVKARL
jgi:hypothetical protein